MAKRKFYILVILLNYPAIKSLINRDVEFIYLETITSHSSEQFSNNVMDVTLSNNVMDVTLSNNLMDVTLGNNVHNGCNTQ